MGKVNDIINAVPKAIYVILALVVLQIINEQLFKRMRSTTKDRTITKTTIAFFILLAVVPFVLSLDLKHETKGYILTFLEIIISAGVALGSTTILGNLIAGLINKTIGRFRNGDLIKIGDLHGGVTKTSVFHIEI